MDLTLLLPENAIKVIQEVIWSATKQSAHMKRPVKKKKREVSQTPDVRAIVTKSR